MPIISAYCKKGGVGKTTFLGYLAHYYANLGNNVLVLSADDQNSIFKIFGKENLVTDHDDDFFEYFLLGRKTAQEVSFEVRPGMYLMKTLNTDALSVNLIVKRPEETRLKRCIDELNTYFDYIFIDFPPSSSRLTEILLDISDTILLVVGLDALGIDGYKNTIQYFIDSDIEISKIKYIIPVKYHPVKIAPNQCLKELKKMRESYTPNAIIATPIKEKSVIQNLQAEGISVFDEHTMKDRFHTKNRDEIKKDLLEVYKSINL